MSATEFAGFVGAGLAAAAYVPQIWHLVRAHCSAGLSRFAFGVWLASSVLVTSHAVAMGAAVFIALGTTQMLATGLILAYTIKYQNSRCLTHLPPKPVLAGTSGPIMVSADDEPLAPC